MAQKALLKGFAKARAAKNARNTTGLSNFSFDRGNGFPASESGTCEEKIVRGLASHDDPSDDRLLLYEKGHVLEIVVAGYFEELGYQKVAREAFDNAPSPCFCGGDDQQYTLEHPTLPVGAHPDFIVKQRNGNIAIVECKAKSSIPDVPYPTETEQLHVQMGLAQLKFPGQKISGSIYMRDLNRGAEEVFDYVYNKTLFNYLLKKGMHLVLAKQGKAAPTCTTGFLCGSFCDHREGCSAFAGAAPIPAHVLEIAERVEQLQRSKKALEAELTAAKEELLAFTGENFRGEQDGIYLVASTVKTTTFTDPEKVSQGHPEIFADCQVATMVLDTDKFEALYPDIAADCQSQLRAGFTKVDVNLVKPKATKAEKASATTAETAETSADAAVAV